MERINLKKANNAQPHYLYDLSLPLPERKLKRIPFVSAMAAAAFLGVPPQIVYISRSRKSRIWSESQGRWFAIRIANFKNEPTNV